MHCLYWTLLITDGNAQSQMICYKWIVLANFQPQKEDAEEGAVRPPPVGVILAARRRARLTNTCILISALMVLAVGVVGGIYLYKHFVRGVSGIN